MLFDFRFRNVLDEMDFNCLGNRLTLYILLFIRNHPDARNSLKQRDRETHEIRQTFCETNGF